MIALLLAWWGCGGPSFPDAADRDLYRSIVTQRVPDAEQELPRCATIREPDLAGDCALAVALRAGVASGEPLKWCDAVPKGAWRDECGFLAAEHRRKQGRTEQALEACQRAGRFAQRCTYHLWQDDLTGVVRQTAALPLEEATEAALPVYARWSERVGDQPLDPGDLPLGAPAPEDTFPSVFWTRFHQQRFEREEAPVLADCAGIARQEACEAGVLDVLRRRALDRRASGGACEAIGHELEERAKAEVERVCRE